MCLEDDDVGLAPGRDGREQPRHPRCRGPLVRDGETSRAIVAMKPEAISYERACGRRPINGLLVAAKRRGMRAEVLDLRSSGDTAGDRAEVVGYGAYSFEE